MTSAAPAKKPYRKAPPEHRELRLEVPGSRLEREVSMTVPHAGWRSQAPEAGCLADFSHLRGLLPPLPELGGEYGIADSTWGLLAAAVLVGAV